MHSIEKRWSCVFTLLSGQSKSDTSIALSIPLRSVERIWARYNATGTVEGEPRKSKSLSGEQLLFIYEEFEAQPDFFLDEVGAINVMVGLPRLRSPHCNP